jgi:predicted Zn-dependent protease
MYIYTQLFQTVDSEDALAAVMAHEFAHVYGRHVQGGMNRQYAILAAAAAAGAGGYALGGDSDQRMQYAGYGAGLGMLAGQFVGMGFTRKDETESDRMGFDFYVRAGWDPEKFDDFFVKMIEMGYDKGPEFLSSHPSMATRVEAIRQWVKELPPEAKEWRRPAVADGSRFKQLQQRSVEVGKNMPSDTSLENAQELLAALPRSCLTPAIHEDQQKAEQRVMAKMQAEQQQQQAGSRAPSK